MPSLPLRISRKMLLVLLVALVVEMAGVTAFYLQQQSLVAAMDARLAKSKADLTAAKTLSDQMTAVQEKLDKDTDQLRQLEGALPTKQYVPTLLTQLQALAEKTHNRILSLKPNLAPPPPRAPVTNNPANGTNNPTNGTNNAAVIAPPPPPEPAYDKYMVELSVQGRYKDVMLFLTQLTQFPKIVSVDLCQITNQAAATGPQEGLVTANLKFTGYILKEAVKGAVAS